MPDTIDWQGHKLNIDAALLELERLDCEESLYKFLEHAWRFIDPAPFKPGWVIDALAEHLEAVCDGEIRRLLINIPPRCPVAADALIPTYERGLVRLDSVRVGERVLTHKGRFRRVQGVHRQGRLPVQRLTTRRGREVVAAPDHPFLTPTGWVDLGRLEVDDVVGVVPQRLVSGRPTVTPEEARLLGYLIGDGSCQGSPNITVADEIEAADIHLVIGAAGFDATDQTYELTKTGGVLRRVVLRAKPGTLKRPNKKDVGPVRTFITRHGLWKRTSYTKMVPTAVLEGSESIVRAFIGAYWACDGFITTKGPARNGTLRDDLLIGCDSVNKAFLLQMQTLLLRLGIDSIVRKKVAKIRTKKQGDTYTSYTLILSDQDNCWRFADQIDIHHAKGAKLVLARRRRFDFDRSIIGDVVERIEEAGETECVCLTVEEDASFVANGFAVHNSKSSICSVAFPAWVWAQKRETPTSGPRVPFLHASYGYNLSLRDSVKCRRLIKSTWYRRLWGHRFGIVKEQDQKIRFRNNLDGERLITSIGSGVTGEGGNIIIVDDANAADEVLSDAVIKSTNEDWWDGTMGTRLNDQKTGAFIVVQQRLGENDLTGHILDKEGNEWVHLMLPMEYEPERSFVTSIGWKDPRTEPGELLWPERFGHEEVAALRRRLGSWKASGQLQQRPEPAGGGIIKRDWWQLWPPGGESQDPIERMNKPLQFPPISFVIAYLDTAYTEKTMNDPSAMTVWGVFSSEALGPLATEDLIAIETRTTLTDRTRTVLEFTPRVMLMGAWSERLELNPLVLLTDKTCRQFKVDLLVIENKAAGISVGQELKRLFRNADYSVQLNDPKGLDKLARLYSVQHIFEDKMVYAPDRQWAEMVMAQCVIEGTKIITAHGLKKVEEIAPGDMVLTHKGRFRPVLRMLSRRASDVVALSGKTLDELVVTPEHPVYTASLSQLRDVETVEWKEAGDITPRRYRVVQRGGQEVEEAQPSRCDALCIPVPVREHVLDEIDLRGWAAVTQEKAHELLDDGEFITSTHIATKWLRWRQVLDHAFGRVCGLYLAEGSYSRHAACWSFNARTEQHFIDEVQTFLRDRIGCSSYVDHGQGAATVRASLSLLEPFFRSFGSGAANKHVPEWAWDAPDTFITGLLEGYVDGDGHVQKDGLVIANTVSESLAWGMRLLAARLGIRAAVRHNREAGTVVIDGRTSNTLPRFSVSWRPARQNNGACIEYEGGLFYSTMRVERRSIDVAVYDLTVFEDHSYCTTGGAVHNCGTFPNAKNDDLVDTTSGALRRLRDLGMLSRLPEVRHEVEAAARHQPRAKRLYPS